MAVDLSIIPNPTFDQKIGGCKDQCENNQDCRFFVITYGQNGEENWCVLYKSCDVMVASAKPGIIFAKQVTGTKN